MIPAFFDNLKDRQRKYDESERLKLRKELRFRAALAFATIPHIDANSLKPCGYPALEEAVAAADRLLQVLDEQA